MSRHTMRYLLVVLSFILSGGECLPLNNTDNLLGLQDVDRHASQPLYLTPFLEKRHILTARSMSEVHLSNFTDIKSYSGFFTVDKECDSNLFFWFFRAEKNWRKAPVVLWLSGGPGSSSLVGLFKELGPISFEKKLLKRQYSWNLKNNLLFIDQPVGTGFSFTGKGCYAKNETQISNDLYSALVQFYQLFPILRKNKFYISGQSFAGHYIPAIGYTIHKNNPFAKHEINLSGLMIGNGLMDIMSQNEYSNLLYQLGLVDDHQKNILKIMEKKMVEHVKEQDWTSATNDLFMIRRVYKGFMDKVSEFNFLENLDRSNEPWEEFITSQKNRESIHVGNHTFSKSSEQAHYNLLPYIVQSVKGTVEELLEHYPVIFYHGQLDIVCAYSLAVKFFRNLQWSGTRDYLQAARQQWCVEDQLAGYFKSAHNLHEVLVRSAGHSVPHDQPLWAFDLMNSVTSSPAHDPLRQLKTCW